LDTGVISVEQAKAQAQIGKQANNVLKYELERADTEMKLFEFNRDNVNAALKLRLIETKPFD